MSTSRPRAQHLRRSAQLQGLKRPPQPDPRLRPWPVDCVTIVAATPGTVNVRGIRGEIRDGQCADYGTRLSVDSASISMALSLPAREGRPLRTICADCCLQYDRTGVQIIDNRLRAAEYGDLNQEGLDDE